MKIKIFILAIAPIVACLFWIYLKDKYEKEPIPILIKYFILGIISSLLALVIENLLIKVSIFEGMSLILYTSFIVAGFTEESLKAMILIPNLLKEKQYNEKLDGIVYSVFLSLGFAAIENIIYIFYESEELILQVSLSRAVIAIPAHIMFAITMGYYISKYKFEEKKPKKQQYIIIAVIIPILLHGIFDFILMIKYRWSIIMFIVYIIFLWKINLDKLDKYINISKIRFLRYIKNRQRKRKTRKKDDRRD